MLQVYKDYNSLVESMKHQIEKLHDKRRNQHDAKDDADANATKVLSVAPKNDSPTKSTLHADATLAGPDDSFDDNATLRNVVKLWQSTTLSSHAGNGGHGGDDVDESADSQLMKNRDMDRPVTLNVGGKKFEVPKRR